MAVSTPEAVRKVAIVGGTHGNEFTGIYLVKKFDKLPALIQRSSFECSTIVANPEAFAAQKRYLEKDLNRCFSNQILQAASSANSPSTHEENRARTLYRKLLPQNGLPTDFIIDIHSTTASMGITLIPSSDHPFNLRLAAYLSRINPEIKTYSWLQQGSEQSFLRAICPLGCAVEVGPVAGGRCRYGNASKNGSRHLSNIGLP